MKKQKTLNKAVQRILIVIMAHGLVACSGYQGLEQNGDLSSQGNAVISYLNEDGSLNYNKFAASEESAQSGNAGLVFGDDLSDEQIADNVVAAVERSIQHFEEMEEDVVVTPSGKEISVDEIIGNLEAELERLQTDADYRAEKVSRIQSVRELSQLSKEEARARVYSEGKAPDGSQIASMVSSDSLPKLPGNRCEFIARMMGNENLPERLREQAEKNYAEQCQE